MFSVKEIRTDTVKAKSVKSRSDISGEPLAAAIGLDTLVEASVVAPATNSKADLDVVVEEATDLLERLEGLVLSTRLGGEEGRVGKGHHDVGDAASDILGGKVLSVPSFVNS